MARIYSSKLSTAQNAAFEHYENLTSCLPFAINEFERGEITASELWNRNVQWLVSVAGDAQKIQFPG